MQLLILIVSGLALWTASVPTPVACAHAVPLSSTPAPNTVLVQAPQEIRLRFSERVEARASSLQVLNAHGQRIDDGHAAVDRENPRLYRIGLRSVEGGTYTVSWRVMSADDGHVTEGAYVFLVGESVVPRQSAVGRIIAVTGYLDARARWVGMLSTTALIGLLTASLVFRRQQPPHIPPPLHVLPWLATLLLGGSLVLLARMHQIASEESLWANIGRLMSTTVGAILAAKLGVVAFMVGLGGYHQCIVQRRILASLTQSEGSTDLVSQRLKQTLRIEAGLGGLALLLAAFLGTTSPPLDLASPVVETFQQTQDVEDAQVMLEIWPLHPGPNTIRLNVTDGAGRALTDATAALLQLQSEASETAPIHFILDREATGGFIKKEAVLGIEGRWVGRVIVQRQEVYDLNARFEVRLTSPTEPYTPAPSVASPSPWASFAYVGILGVTVFLLLTGKRRLSSALQHLNASPQHRVSHADRR